MAEIDLGTSGWHSGISYTEEQKVFKDFLKKIEDFQEKEDKKIFKRKDTIAWTPEFDDMMLTFLTPKEIKQYESNGKTKKEILKIAEKEIRELGYYTDKWGKKNPGLHFEAEKRDYEKMFEENKVHEVVNVLRQKTTLRMIPADEYGYPDKVAEAEKKNKNTMKTETEKRAPVKDAAETKPKTLSLSAFMAKMKQGGR